MPSALFIDANLIVLLVVGQAGRDLIAKHRRTRTLFAVEDYARLFKAISAGGEMPVTPDTFVQKPREIRT